MATPSMTTMRSATSAHMASNSAVEAPVGLRRVGHRAGRQQRHLPALHDPVDHEGDDGGEQQDQPTTAPIWKFCWPITCL